MREARNRTDGGKRRRTMRGGLTLVELMTAMVVALLLIVCAGILMADSQKNYNRIFTRVNGDRTTDGQAAIKAFDTICRQATSRRVLLGSDEQILQVYYYSDPGLSFPDRYARFYATGSNLLLEKGALEPYSWQEDTSATQTMELAGGLEQVRFKKEGLALQMFLTFQDPSGPGTVVCSSIRHSE